MNRRLGSSQRAVLLAAAHSGDGGITKGRLLGKLWAVMDRLEEMRALQMRSIEGRGPVYFITDKGLSALGQYHHRLTHFTPSLHSIRIIGATAPSGTVDHLRSPEILRR